MDRPAFLVSGCVYSAFAFLLILESNGTQDNPIFSIRRKALS